MRRTLRALGLACLTSLAFAAFVRGTARAESAATTSSPLTLDEVLSAAEKSFPLLKAAALERDVAEADLLSAEGGFDLSWKTRGTLTPVGYYESLRAESVVEKPTSLWGVSGFAGWKYGRGDFATYNGSQQTLEYGEVRAGVNVPIWRNGPIDRRRANLARAELGQDIAALSVKDQRIQVRRAATHRYWAWVAAGAKVAIAKDLLAIVEDRDAGLATRVERGDLPKIERTDNARAIEQRRAQLALARRSLEQASIELGLYLRDAEGRATLPPENRLPSALAEPSADDGATPNSDTAFALGARPELRRFRLQMAQNVVEMDWAKNQLMPGIDVQLAGSQDLGRAMPSRPDLSKPVFEATLMLDIPIQTRAMRGRRDAAAFTLRRIERQVDFANDRVRADVQDAHSALRGARERIVATRKEVVLARELEEAERTRFAQGDSHLLIVNLREQQTAEAELREVDALLDFHRAVADRKAARGE
ncbi:MAG: TolC family protein [Polyangiaceae bacterium]